MTNLWEPVRSKPLGNDPSHQPPECDEHTAVVYEDFMYVFGGFVNGDRSNEVYKFNFKSAEWSHVDGGAHKPEERAGHSAVVVELEGVSFMYIFGGKNNNDQMLNDMWRLNLSNEQWELV